MAASPSLPALPSLSLPKGGGALRGMGETFTVNSATGTGSVTLPLPVSVMRGAEPKLSLTYSGGSGNGVFGLGWNVDLPQISRRTDKGVPRYAEVPGQADTFLLSGSDDLVPALRADGAPDVFDWMDLGVAYRVTRYRPRIEVAFSRIEHWCNITTQEVHWRTVTRDNVVSVFGDSPESRVADPDRTDHVFTWLIARTWTDRGDLTLYRYAAEDLRQVSDPAFEAQRRSGAARHPKRIIYGFDDPFDPAAPALPLTSHFELVFDYGDHDPAAPGILPDRDWPARLDPQSSYRSGFEIRTHRLCRRVLMFHRFAELGPAPVPVRQLALTYVADDPARAHEGHSLALLASATLTGRAPSGPESLPPVQFDYTPARLRDEVTRLSAADLANLPGGIGVEDRFVDLDGKGVPGILSEEAGGWYYKRAQPRYDPDGIATPRAGYGPLSREDWLPADAGANTAAGAARHLVDVAGDGRLALAVYDGPLPGVSVRNPAGGWKAHRPFARLATGTAGGAMRALDLTGDGRSDLMELEADHLRWWPGAGFIGQDPERRVPLAPRWADRPGTATGDTRYALLTLDMTGDGLSDLVRIGNGHVTVWPSLGHGRFAPPIRLRNAPRFDDAGRFDPNRLRPGDVDGTGPTDLIYLHPDGPRLYRNQAGNGFAPAERLPAGPRADEWQRASLVDLNGSGTACLVWSDARQTDRALRVIDLMGGTKPWMLVGIRNNQGSETRIRYRPSTAWYVEDRAAGRPWLTRLPMPVQLVAETESFDHVLGRKLASRFSYHHGHYDGPEREFRGFARVEQIDTQSLSRHMGAGLFTEHPVADGDVVHLPPVRTRTWYHTGALIGSGPLSRALAQEYWAGDPQAILLDDIVLDSTLDAAERRHATRALKGGVLRVEVYSDDGTPEASIPHTVTETNARLRRLQRAVGTSPPVFLVEPGEQVAHHYERVVDDPRVTHRLTLATDRLGFPLRVASVCYARRPGLDRLPEQAVTKITISEAAITHRDDAPDWQRLGVSVEAREWEVHNLPVPATGQFTAAELDATFLTLPRLPNEADPGTAAAARLLLHQRSYYRSDDLSARLPLGQVGRRAILHETRQLALTAGQIVGTFGGRVTPAILTEGGYVTEDGEPGWVSSGQTFFSPVAAGGAAVELAAAQANFWLVRRSVDPFGNSATVDYDPYRLLPVASADAAGNRTVARPHYRTLAHDKVTDANGLVRAVRFDALGMVIATFRYRGAEGDRFVETAQEADAGDVPGTMLTHDLFAWQRGDSPCYVHLRTRVRHGDTAAPVEESRTYCDGSGAEAMRKAQAEPGQAPLRGVGGALLRDADGTVLMGEVADRWVGSGRVIVDNKGNPVKQYEPFFDSGPGWVSEADLAQTGATTLLRYDPLGRVIRTDHPDGRFRKAQFGPWSATTWDENDTAADSVWFAARGAPTAAPPEADVAGRAAWLSARQHGTPAIAHIDGLGRTCRTMTDLGPATPGAPHRQLQTRSVRNTEGHLLAMVDPRGRTVARYAYDMLGRRLRQQSLDGDDALELPDVSGAPLRRWTRRGFSSRCDFDSLRRPLRLWITDPSGTETLAERQIYGEDHPQAAALGLRGMLFRHYHSAGMAEQSAFDFKGLPISGRSVLAADPRVDPDWAALAALGADPAALDAAAAALLEPVGWTEVQRHDALDRVVQSVAPHQPSRSISVTQPRFGRGGLLAGLDVWTGLGAVPTGLLDPATANHAVISETRHDAYGRRLTTSCGTAAVQEMTYDPRSFRLTGIRTRRLTGPAATRMVQDLVLTHDALGNVVEIADAAQQDVFFANAVASPVLRFEHDALDRLIRAEGREHLGLGIGSAAPPQASGTDDSFRRVAHRHDGQAVGRYAQSYTYDDAGNMTEVAHSGPTGAWRRLHAHDAPSTLEPGQQANLLTATSRPGDAFGGAFSDRYGYDLHGNMISAPHLSRIEWSADDALRSTARQATGPGLVPETTWYTIGPNDNRLCKVTDRAREAGDAPRRRHETLYLGAVDIRRDYAADGMTVTREVETLTVADSSGVMARIETQVIDRDEPAREGRVLVRFAFTTHLRSVALELDSVGRLITYEEFFPFGGTAMLIEDRALRAAAKRFRYSGKELDDESGFVFFGARSYAPWLCRWISPDPEGIGDHINAYVFVQNNPVTHLDANGRWTWGEVAVVAAVVTVAVVVTVATAGAGAALIGAAASAGAAAGGATGAAIATGVATVAVGAASGAIAGGAADITAQGLTTGTVDLGRTGAAMAGGAAAGGVLSVIPGVSAARSVSRSLNTGIGAVAAARAGTSSAARAVVASRAVAATNVASTTSGSALRAAATGAGRGAVSGAVGGGVDEAARQSAAGESRDWSRVAATTATGAAFGAVGGAAPSAVAAVRRSRVVERAASALVPGRKTPAAAAVHEPASGRVFTGANAPPSRPLHPLMQEGIDEFAGIPTNTHRNYFGMPGQAHAEVNALSDALYARQRALGREMTREDLSSMLLHIERRGGPAAGTPMDRCPRCSMATSGVELTPATRQAELTWFNRIMSGNYDPNSPLP